MVCWGRGFYDRGDAFFRFWGRDVWESVLTPAFGQDRELCSSSERDGFLKCCWGCAFCCRTQFPVLSACSRKHWISQTSRPQKRKKAVFEGRGGGWCGCFEGANTVSRCRPRDFTKMYKHGGKGLKLSSIDIIMKVENIDTR